jgi:isoleucyl-tRNA synthetase
LTEVFLWYLKMLAPFAPFITEYLYLLLMRNIFENSLWESIHILGWELLSKHYINENLQEEIDLVRKIIRLWLYIRAKNKIKIKQPLKKMEIRV